MAAPAIMKSNFSAFNNGSLVPGADDALSSFLSVNRHIVLSVKHVASRGDFMVFYLSSLVNSGLYFISLKR